MIRKIVSFALHQPFFLILLLALFTAIADGARPTLTVLVLLFDPLTTVTVLES